MIESHLCNYLRKHVPHRFGDPAGSVLHRDLSAECFGRLTVRWIVQRRSDPGGQPLDRQSRERHRSWRDPETSKSTGPEELVDHHGHCYGGLPGPYCGTGGAGATVVHDDGHRGKQPVVRGITDADHIVAGDGEACPTGLHNAAHPRGPQRADGERTELVRVIRGHAAKPDEDGRRPSSEKLDQGGWWPPVRRPLG